MSIYTKIERFESEPRLIQLRGLSAQLGEDQQGALTATNPTFPFFSIFSVDDRCLLRAETGLFFDEEEFLPGKQSWLLNQNKIRVDDYKISLFVCSNKAEVLARSKEPVPLEILESASDLPYLEVKVAHLSRKFHLFPNIELTVGSGLNTSIKIDMVRLCPNHFSVNYHVDKVLLNPLEGSVLLDGQEIKGTKRIHSNCRLKLEPSGLEVKLHWPK